MIATDDCELGIKALGAVVWYLKRCLIDYQLLTMGRFSIYQPLDAVTLDVNQREEMVENFNKHMVGCSHKYARVRSAGQD